MLSLKQFSILSSFIFFLCFSIPGKVYPVEQMQKISTEAGVFRYFHSASELSLTDSNGKKIRTFKNNAQNETIIGIDYSADTKEFVLFRELMTKTGSTYTYSLRMESENSNRILKSNSALPFYTPVIIEKNSAFTYITDNSEIIICDLNTSEIIRCIKFPLPVSGLKKEFINNELYICFNIPQGLSLKSIKIKADSLMNYTYTPDLPEKSDQKASLRNKKIKTVKEPDISEFLRDDKSILCFGDSITLGYINCQKAPEKGYVPKLEKILKKFSNHFTVINSGKPAEYITPLKENRQREGGADRICKTIADCNSKYFIFHEGTNDIKCLPYVPESQIIYWIKTIINIVKENDMEPLLTTIIPQERIILEPESSLAVRGRRVAEGIRLIRDELNVKFVDLWNIFSDYPESDGGYEALMSDYVHPSEKGYQLMAEKFFEVLEEDFDFKPTMPENISIHKPSYFQIKITWDQITKPSHDHFIFEYGYSDSNLDKIITLTATEYSFIKYFLENVSHNKIYFRLCSVNKSGQKSDYTEIFTARYLFSAVK